MSTKKTFQLLDHVQQLDTDVLINLLFFNLFQFILAAFLLDTEQKLPPLRWALVVNNYNSKQLLSFIELISP